MAIFDHNPQSTKVKNLFLLVVPILLYSCVKKNGGSSAPNPCNNITQAFQYSLSGPQLTATISYDAQGRITEVVGEGQNHSVYTYYKDSIVLKATDIYGGDLSETFYLDGNQHILRSNLYDYNCQYDADGYLISYSLPVSNGPGDPISYIPYTLSYSNGNLVEVKTTAAPVSLADLTFSYYDKPNQDVLGYNSFLYVSELIGSRQDFFLIPGGFWGKDSKNLPDSIHFHNIYYPDGNFVYQNDSSGRISVIPEDISFTYQCP